VNEANAFKVSINFHIGEQPNATFLAYCVASERSLHNNWHLHITVVDVGELPLTCRRNFLSQCASIIEVRPVLRLIDPGIDFPQKNQPLWHY
jgi:hypothetical protein